MLQCTGFAAVPEMGALVVLIAMNAEAGPTTEVPDLDDMLLCELGEHDGATEHAAQLWAGEMDAARDLWMFWIDAGADVSPDPDPDPDADPDPGPGPDADNRVRRTFRFVELPPCLAVMRTLATGEREACLLFDRHPAPHSWDVTDPLADLMAERMREEIRRERGGEPPT
ncbi:hypothetical protein [Streptomyces sp. NPDC088755]|uniref:hypothetical protein n=1 Tax=Streptomyces sp. NPDC088755 TaxID=3365888 RepID=UPI0038090C45